MSQEYRGNGKSGIVFPDIFSLCIELCGLKTLFSETLVQKYQKTCVRERSCSPFFFCISSVRPALPDTHEHGLNVDVGGGQRVNVMTAFCVEKEEEASLSNDWPVPHRERIRDVHLNTGVLPPAQPRMWDAFHPALPRILGVLPLALGRIWGLAHSSAPALPPM